MKTAVLLLAIGLIIGLVVPYYVQEKIADAGIVWPGFPWYKSPPRTFSFSVPVFLRIVGCLFVALAVIRFLFVGKNQGH